MKNINLFAIDSGRRAVKIEYYNHNTNLVNKEIIDSKFGIANFSFLKYMKGISFDKEIDIIVKVDDSNLMILGKTCDKLLPPEKVNYVLDDNVYLDYSILYILASIGKYILKSELKILLTINLTFNNNNDTTTQKIKEKLIGKHLVIFYDLKGNEIKKEEFDIENVAVYYQGESSVMSKALDSNLNFVDKYYKDGIVIDVGRKSTDVALMRCLESVKGISFNSASEDLFVFISERLYERYRININTLSIENKIFSDEKLLLRSGEEIDLKNILKEAVLYVSETLRTKIEDSFGSYQPSWIMLTGGGVVFFKDVFLKMFPGIEILDDYIYSNCDGMMNLLMKYN